MCSKAVERRRAVRYGFGGVAELIDAESAKSLVSIVSELSRFGCFVRTTDPYAKEVSVHLKITHKRKQFETTGRVVDTRAGGMAIAFEAISPESEAVLEDWLNEAKARSAGCRGLWRIIVSCKWDFDPTNKILRSRFWGQVTDEDLLNHERMELLLAGSLDPLGAIIDLSDADPFEATPEGMRRLAKLPPGMPKAERPYVVVAPSDSVFGLLRIFEIEGGATRPNLHLVRSIEKAYVILGVREAQFEEISKLF